MNSLIIQHVHRQDDSSQQQANNLVAKWSIGCMTKAQKAACHASMMGCYLQPAFHVSDSWRSMLCLTSPHFVSTGSRAAQCQCSWRAAIHIACQPRYTAVRRAEIKDTHSQLLSQLQYGNSSHTPEAQRQPAIGLAWMDTFCSLISCTGLSAAPAKHPVVLQRWPAMVQAASQQDQACLWEPSPCGPAPPARQ